MFQPVDVVHLDLLLHHVVQVEHALVNLIFLAASALHAKQGFMTIQTAIVRKIINSLCKSDDHSFTACDCNISGSISTSCNSSGECTCKSNVSGTKCATCMSGYYGFPNCQGRFLMILI